MSHKNILMQILDYEKVHAKTDFVNTFAASMI